MEKHGAFEVCKMAKEIEVLGMFYGWHFGFKLFCEWVLLEGNIFGCMRHRESSANPTSWLYWHHNCWPESPQRCSWASFSEASRFSLLICSSRTVTPAKGMFTLGGSSNKIPSAINKLPMRRWDSHLSVANK